MIEPGGIEARLRLLRCDVLMFAPDALAGFCGGLTGKINYLSACWRLLDSLLFAASVFLGERVILSALARSGFTSDLFAFSCYSSYVLTCCITGLARTMLLAFDSPLDYTLPSLGEFVSG